MLQDAYSALMFACMRIMCKWKIIKYFFAKTIVENSNVKPLEAIVLNNLNNVNNVNCLLMDLSKVNCQRVHGYTFGFHMYDVCLSSFNLHGRPILRTYEHSQNIMQWIR